ncbi:hypothetical protein BWR60_07565 [Inquilinus limosus]|uniref:Uncharacterized protein n=1 Tax=Inquilinus limosus TaxID=171674 RepID=A0A211ZRB6_9PROT|nr:hypothetical protein BWR60_07565 [Inquilinus limosus]
MCLQSFPHRIGYTEGDFEVINLLAGASQDPHEPHREQHVGTAPVSGIGERTLIVVQQVREDFPLLVREVWDVLNEPVEFRTIPSPHLKADERAATGLFRGVEDRTKREAR